MPLAARHFINHVLPPDGGSIEVAPKDLTQLMWSIGCVVCVLVPLSGLLKWQQTMCGERAAQGFLAHVRNRMYEHLQRLGQGYFDRRPVGRVLVRFVGDSNSLRTWLARTVITVPADILTIVGIAVALGVIRPAFLIAAIVPLMLLFVPALAVLNPRARHWTRQGRRSQTRLCGLLSDRLGGIGPIKAANLQVQDRREVRSMIDQVADANVRRGRLDAWAETASAAATMLAVAAVVVWGMHLSLVGRVSHGDLLSGAWLALLLRGPVTRLGRANVIHQRARVAADRIESLLKREPEPGWSSEQSDYAGPGRQIELERIGYKDLDGIWMIRDLNATIQGPGIVVVSDDGGLARTALLELLLRLRRPHEGRIKLDGLDVRGLRVADARRRMGWVDRQRRLVDMRGLWAASPDEAERFGIRKAWESTSSIAPGMSIPLLDGDSPESAQGSPRVPTLSPEARLRVALCLALVDDPPMVLIDEPTLGLEPEAIERVTAWIEKASRDRLIILASNDPRALEIADQTIDLGPERDRPGDAQSERAACLDESSMTPDSTRGDRDGDLP